MAEAAVTSEVRSRSRSIFHSRLEDRQNEVLQNLATNYGFSLELTRTPTDRGITHWQHAHLVTALDTLNSYQKSRRAKSVGLSMQRQYTKDPRTRCIELLKHWLRTNANNKNLSEEEVRRLCNFCSGVIHHHQVFPGRNAHSFMATIADVYNKDLQIMLREVLVNDKTCADLAQQVLSMSRNFISDAIAYLLVAPTDLKQTDKLKSLVAVSLMTTLPAEGHPLPARTDPRMQKEMKDAWATLCGSLLAALLKTRWSVRLFEGASAQSEADLHAHVTAAIQDMVDANDTSPKAAHLEMSGLLDKVQTGREDDSFKTMLELLERNVKTSGLAGPFRKKEGESRAVREEYLLAIVLLRDLIYILGEAFILFQSLSGDLGDYGMIRAATALHPTLSAIVEKVHSLKNSMERLNNAVEKAIVFPKSHRESIPKPVPSENMMIRAREAMERAVKDNESHATLLVKAIEDLRARSSKERLPQVMDSIAKNCVRLDAVLHSPQFLARVGDNFPRDLPRLVDVTQARVDPTLQITGLDAPASIQYDSDVTIEELTPASSIPDARADASPASSRGQALAKRTVQKACTLSFPEAAFKEVISPRRPTLTLLDAPFEADKSPAALSFWEEAVAPHIDAGMPAGWSAKSPRSTSLPPQPKQQPLSAGPPKIRSQRSREMTANIRSQRSMEMTAFVCRLSSSQCGPSLLKKNDWRSLRLTSEGKLEIYEKKSNDKVKTSVDVREEIAECMVREKVMFLTILRVPKKGSKEHGVFEHKDYRFQFHSVDEAAEFGIAIKQLQ